jgi:hypothetical protein
MKKVVSAINTDVIRVQDLKENMFIICVSSITGEVYKLTNHYFNGCRYWSFFSLKEHGTAYVNSYHTRFYDAICSAIDLKANLYVLDNYKELAEFLTNHYK